MKHCLFTLLLFLVTTVYAQTAQKDSLAKILLSNPNDTKALLEAAKIYRGATGAGSDTNLYYLTKAVSVLNNVPDDKILTKVYAELGIHYLYKDDYTNSNHYLRKALLLSYKIEDYLSASKILGNLGQNLIFEYKLKDAYDTLVLAEDVLRHTKIGAESEKQLIQIWGYQSILYKELGLIDSAIARNFRILEYLKKFPEDYGRDAPYSYMNIANCYTDTKDYDKAISYFKKAMKDMKSDPDSVRNKRVATLNIAAIYLEKNRLDSSTYWCEVLKTSLTENASHWLGYYQLMAQIFEKQSAFDKAILYTNKSIELSKKRNDIGGVNTGYKLLAEIYSAQQEFAMSNVYAEMCLPFFSGSQEEALLLYKMISRNYEHLKLSNESLKFYKKYDSLNSEILTAEKLKIITAQEIKYETSLKESKIAKQQSELKAKTRQRNWLIAGGLFAILAATLLGLLYRRTRNQKERIQQQNTIIENQKREILHSQSNSFNLIRSMFRRQSTSALQAASSKTNDERLFAFSLLHELLYNDNSNHIELKTFLQKLCDARAIQESIEINTNFPENVKLKADTLRTIGIIINELISNAVKHAFDSEEKRQIDVFVERNGQIFNLKVKDNGKGIPASFSIDDFNDGFGIKYINELVQQYGGTINAYNNLGANFDITLNV